MPTISDVGRESIDLNSFGSYDASGHQYNEENNDYYSLSEKIIELTTTVNDLSLKLDKLFVDSTYKIEILEIGPRVGHGVFGTVYKASVKINDNVYPTGYLIKSTEESHITRDQIDIINQCPYTICYVGYAYKNDKKYIIFKEIDSDLFKSQNTITAKINTFGKLCSLLLKYLETIDCLAGAGLNGIDMNGIGHNNVLVDNNGVITPKIYDLDSLTVSGVKSPIGNRSMSADDQYEILRDLLHNFLIRKSSQSLNDVSLMAYLCNFYPDVHHFLDRSLDDNTGRDAIYDFLKANQSNEAFTLPIDLSLNAFALRLLPDITVKHLYFTADRILVIPENVDSSKTINCDMYVIDDDEKCKMVETSLNIIVTPNNLKVVIDSVPRNLFKVIYNQKIKVTYSV